MAVFNFKTILKESFAKIPAFLGFILAPYFYFTGASYENAKLDEYGLADAGFSSSATDKIFSGFNVFLNVILPDFASYLGYTVTVTIFGGILWLAVSKSPSIRVIRFRSKLNTARAAVSDYLAEVGIVLAPLGAVIATMLFLSFFLGWISLMDLGRKSGISDARQHINNIRSCVKAQSRIVGCTRLLVRFNDNHYDQIVSAVVMADGSRAAISNGRYIRFIETKQLIAIQVNKLPIVRKPNDKPL